MDGRYSVHDQFNGQRDEMVYLGMAPNAFPVGYSHFQPQQYFAVPLNGQPNLLPDSSLFSAAAIAPEYGLQALPGEFFRCELPYTEGEATFTQLQLPTSTPQNMPSFCSARSAFVPSTSGQTTEKKRRPSRRKANSKRPSRSDDAIRSSEEGRRGRQREMLFEEGGGDEGKKGEGKEREERRASASTLTEPRRRTKERQSRRSNTEVFATAKNTFVESPETVVVSTSIDDSSKERVDERSFPVSSFENVDETTVRTGTAKKSLGSDTIAALLEEDKRSFGRQNGRLTKKKETNGNESFEATGQFRTEKEASKAFATDMENSESLSLPKQQTNSSGKRTRDKKANEIVTSSVVGERRRATRRSAAALNNETASPSSSPAVPVSTSETFSSPSGTIDSTSSARRLDERNCTATVFICSFDGETIEDSVREREASENGDDGEETPSRCDREEKQKTSPSPLKKATISLEEISSTTSTTATASQKTKKADVRSSSTSERRRSSRRQQSTSTSQDSAPSHLPPADDEVSAITQREKDSETGGGEAFSQQSAREDNSERDANERNETVSTEGKLVLDALNADGSTSSRLKEPLVVLDLSPTASTTSQKAKKPDSRPSSTSERRRSSRRQQSTPSVVSEQDDSLAENSERAVSERTKTVDSPEAFAEMERTESPEGGLLQRSSSSKEGSKREKIGRSVRNGRERKEKEEEREEEKEREMEEEKSEQEEEGGEEKSDARFSAELCSDGDLVWVKYLRWPWWPAEVIGEQYIIPKTAPAVKLSRAKAAVDASLTNLREEERTLRERLNALRESRTPLLAVVKSLEREREWISCRDESLLITATPKTEMMCSINDCLKELRREDVLLLANIHFVCKRLALLQRKMKRIAAEQAPVTVRFMGSNDFGIVNAHNAVRWFEEMAINEAERETVRGKEASRTESSRSQSKRKQSAVSSEEMASALKEARSLRKSLLPVQRELIVANEKAAAALETAKSFLPSFEKDFDVPRQIFQDVDAFQRESLEKMIEELREEAIASAEKAAQQKTKLSDVAEKAPEPQFKKLSFNEYSGVSRASLQRPDAAAVPCSCTEKDACDDGCLNRMLMVECDDSVCKHDNCKNRRFQQRRYAEAKRIHLGKKGFGLVATKPLSAGDFVIEYVGEVIDREECEGRLAEKIGRSRKQNNGVPSFYTLQLSPSSYIDAEKKGNNARFVNHSCSPNCGFEKWTVKGETRIGIFALKEIKEGEELTCDYQFSALMAETSGLGPSQKRTPSKNDGKTRKDEEEEKEKSVGWGYFAPCYCGAPNCSGNLYQRPKAGAVTEGERDKTSKKKAKKKKVVHEDDCFICDDGGELMMCSHDGCPKVYHAECVGLSDGEKPKKWQRWLCPWHFCDRCAKPSKAFCQSCPSSWCGDCTRYARLEHVEGKDRCSKCRVYFVKRLAEEKKEREALLEKARRLQQERAKDLREEEENEQDERETTAENVEASSLDKSKVVSLPSLSSFALPFLTPTNFELPREHLLELKTREGLAATLLAQFEEDAKAKMKEEKEARQQQKEAAIASVEGQLSMRDLLSKRRRMAIEGEEDQADITGTGDSTAFVLIERAKDAVESEGEKRRKREREGERNHDEGRSKKDRDTTSKAKKRRGAVDASSPKKDNTGAVESSKGEAATAGHWTVGASLFSFCAQNADKTDAKTSSSSKKNAVASSKNKQKESTGKGSTAAKAEQKKKSKGKKKDKKAQKGRPPIAKSKKTIVKPKRSASKKATKSHSVSLKGKGPKERPEIPCRLDKPSDKATDSEDEEVVI